MAKLFHKVQHVLSQKSISHKMCKNSLLNAIFWNRFLVTLTCMLWNLLERFNTLTSNIAVFSGTCLTITSSTVFMYTPPPEGCTANCILMTTQVDKECTISVHSTPLLKWA